MSAQPLWIARENPRDGDRVRLITRSGYDRTKRYPWIVESALKDRIKQFVIDGEAVVPDVYANSVPSTCEGWR